MFRRGSILVTILAFSLLLMVVAFVLVGQSLMDLSVAEHFRRERLAEEMARSVVAQFIREASSQPQAGPGYWKARFQQPVFPDGGNRLGGTARLNFDSQKPYFSVDNTASDLPAVGWYDRGTSRKSVPPFGISLVIAIDVGGQTQYYEALLQRRWPFVLSTPSPNVQLGRYYALPAYTGPPTEVKGNLLLLPPEPPGPRLVLEPDLFVQVSPLVKNFLNYLNADVTVGPDCSLDGHIYYAAPRPPATVETVTQPSSGKWTGRITTCPSLGDFRQALTLPTLVSPSTLKPVPWGPLTPVTSTLISIGTNTGNYVYNTLTLQNGDYQLDGNTTNLLPVGHPDRCLSAGIELNNARLFVKGNLILRERLNEENKPVFNGIKGNQATLIVSGDLLLEGGDLDAGDQGLVIYCRNLFLGAEGKFNGLFLIQNSAFIRPTRVGQLELRGGILCGAGTVDVQNGAEVKPPETQAETTLCRCLDLASVKLTYDARYTKALQPYGPWQVMSLQRVF